MLGAHLEAERPADTSCPGDPQARTDPRTTAETPQEGGGAKELLRLQQQVVWLHRQLRRQEARWSAALRHLQTQIDALKRQDRGPRGGQGAAELRGSDTRRTPAASLQMRTRSDTQVLRSTFGTISPLSPDQDRAPKHAGRNSHRAPHRGQGLSPEIVPSAQPVSVKIERVDSGKIVTREDGDKTVSISLRVRGAAPAGSGLRTKGKPAPLGGEKAATPPGRSLPTSSGRKPTGPATCGVPLTEDGPAAQDTDPRPLPSEGPKGKSLAQAQMEGLAGPSADTKPQDLPVEPGFSQPTGTGTGKEDKEEETRSPGGKVGKAASAGRKVVTTSKDPKKDTGAKTTILQFLNGDTQRILPDERAVHCCAGAQTTRTTHCSGLEVLRFPNKRTETFYPAGSKETLFPDGTVKRLHDGREETLFPDGTSVSVERNGDRTIVFSNGQRDIHTAQFKRREYPDGTVKTVYSSGLQETKDASGRVRVRHETGSIVLDHEQAVHHSQ